MSTNLEPQILEQIKNAITNNPKVQEIILFGSRAKGMAKNGSDIDVAIVGADLNFKDLCSMGVQVDELNIPYSVDIIDYNTLSNQELKNHIDRVGVILK
jgi:predicted nucleotidyltransferase